VKEYEWRLMVKYNPDQPRIPAGSSGGGQWTSGETQIDPIKQIVSDIVARERAAPPIMGLGKNLYTLIKEHGDPDTLYEVEDLGGAFGVVMTRKTPMFAGDTGYIVSVHKNKQLADAARRKAVRDRRMQIGRQINLPGSVHFTDADDIQEAVINRILSE